MKRKYRIGLVMKSLQADFFKAMREGAERYVASLPDVELMCVGTASQTEIGEQIELMFDFVKEEVDAVVLVPIDSRRLVVPTVVLMEVGIPVINIDIRLEEDLLKQEGMEVAFVGPDNFAAAYEVGKLLSEQLQAGDEVAIIEGLAAADNAMQRRDGFRRTIEDRALNLVASVSADWETEKAVRAFAEIWQRHPQLKAVYCSNDAMALGVLDVMGEEGRYLPVVGFDNDASIQEYLQSGKMLATVDIFGSQMAVRGIEFAIRVLEGKAENRGVHATPYKIIKK